METIYAASLVGHIALIGTYGLVTMQPLAAFVLIAVILGSSSRPASSMRPAGPSTGSKDGWSSW